MRENIKMRENSNKNKSKENKNREYNNIRQKINIYMLKNRRIIFDNFNNENGNSAKIVRKTILSKNNNSNSKNNYNIMISGLSILYINQIIFNK